MKDSVGEGKRPQKSQDLLGAPLQYAYRLLSYRGRSEKEVTDSLRKKGFTEQVIQDTILYLKDRGFINDTALASSLKREAEEVKLLGITGTKTFLQQRGIPREIIDNIFAGKDSDELNIAKKLVDKKLRSMENYSDEFVKKRLWGILARKGYSFDTIRKALKQLKIREEEE